MSSSKLRLGAGLIAFGVAAAGCSGSGSSGDSDSNSGGEAGSSGEISCAVGETDGDLSLFSWTEYLDPDLAAKFSEETGIKLIETSFGSNEEMAPIIMAGASGHDVIVPSDYMVSVLIAAAGAGENSVMPLIKDAIPNLSNLAPDFASGLPYDPEGDWSVPYQWGTTGLGVDLAITGPNVPHSWALIFDRSVAEENGLLGKATLLNDPRESLGAALRYLGYSLNSTDDAELAEAAALVKEASGWLTAFDSTQYDELLVAGEVAVAHGFSGDFIAQFDEADDPDQYTYFVPDEGGTQWVDNMMVVADAPHPCSAHVFINFILDAENGAALSNWNYYASPNLAAEALLDEEFLSDPIVYPPDTSILEFITDTGDQETNFSDAFVEAKG